MHESKHGIYLLKVAVAKFIRGIEGSSSEEYTSHNLATSSHITSHKTSHKPSTNQLLSSTNPSSRTALLGAHLEHLLESFRSEEKENKLLAIHCIFIIF
jgi:hypothetical protein